MRNDISKNISNNLFYLVEEKKTTHKKLAQRIGCDTSTVTKHINGDLGISVEFLTKYADVFDV